MRGTWPSTLRAKALTPNDSAPQAVFGPAIADCGFREPLAPRLARPGTRIGAERLRSTRSTASIERMDLPAAVTAVVARATGSRPASWQRVVAGYTHADKWCIDLGSSTAFVKASANAVGAARSSGKRRSSSASRRRSCRACTAGVLSAGGRCSCWRISALPVAASLSRRWRRIARTRCPCSGDPTASRPRKPAGGTSVRHVLAAHRSRSRARLQTVVLGRMARRCPVVAQAAQSRAVLAGDDVIHDDVWAGDVAYADRGALLIDWPSASIGDRRIDLAYAVLSIRASGARPTAVDFPDEAAYGAPRRRERLPGRAARRRVDRARGRASRGSLVDLDYALVWVCELLDLPPPRA